MGQETASEGRFGYASRHLLVGLRPGRRRAPSSWRPQRAGAGPDGPAARVGRVRARHPLQGHGARGARRRPRPPVHPGRRAARAGRPRVLGDPRPAARPALPGRRHRRRRRRRATRGSAPQDLATFLAGAVRGRRVVAHRPLRVDLRAAARAGHHLARRAGRPAAAGRRRRARAAHGATATRRAPSAGWTTRCSRSFGSRYLDLHGNAHRESLLRARLDKLRPTGNGTR